MATVRKRSWRSPSGEPKAAWIADYFDPGGTRRIRTFQTRGEANAFLAELCFERDRRQRDAIAAAREILRAVGLDLIPVPHRPSKHVEREQNGPRTGCKLDL